MNQHDLFILFSIYSLKGREKRFSALSYECHHVNVPLAHLKFTFYFIYQPVNNADFIIPVEIDGTVHQVWSSTKPFNLLCCYIHMEGKITENELWVFGLFVAVNSGPGLVQVIQDRFVLTSSKAYSG